MSAIASISLARSLSLKETMAAGIGVAFVVLLFSVTSLLHRASGVIPIPIIKGVQVGAGLSLCLNAGAMLSGLGYGKSEWDDNLLWAIGAFAVLYGTSRIPRFPVALVIFCMGIILALIKVRTIHGSLPRFGVWMPFIPTVPFPGDFITGFGTAGVGQVPLTILNSVIAVKYLSEDLLPYRPAPSVTSLGVSVGLMNLVGCWFGAMPVCHGESRPDLKYDFSSSYVLNFLCRIWRFSSPAQIWCSLRGQRHDFWPIQNYYRSYIWEFVDWLTSKIS